MKVTVRTKGIKSTDEIKSYLEHKCICVNHISTSQFDYKLSKGDEVEIYKYSIKCAQKEETNLKIFYELLYYFHL